MTAFRLSKRVDLNFEVQGMILNEDFNRVRRRAIIDAIGQLSAGLTFKLGKKVDFNVIEPMDHNLINELNNRINTLRSENEQLSRRPSSCPDCPPVTPTTQIEEVKKFNESVVYFRLNSAKIDNNQEITIYNMAALAKKENSRIRITGYADAGTGTSAYNMKISERRAKAVAKQLTDKYGIPADKIIIEWKGSDNQIYTTNEWNRITLMILVD